MPVTSLRLAWILLAAYFLGSIPFGLFLAKLLGGSDVRRAGSGNIGAANVGRVVGPLAGILTLLLDTAKGAAAVWLAARFTHESAVWMMLAALAALVGHCFPVWLKFKGGKGVATALGVFLALCPLAALAALFLFALVVACWRYVSLGSISAAAAMPLLMYFLWAPHHAPPLIIAFGSLAAALLVVYKHGANIQRLMQGEEPKFPSSKKKDAA
ncbi:MAG TPA: glycerol-3-phosphate 1-O-acyltransferase PlsY [Candidatus Acidoferrum sp.]|nr:glycerol-3-phosphate 1-O-acyltransferase PlsY [Candidatus Acidoferrum sp.]